VSVIERLVRRLTEVRYDAIDVLIVVVLATAISLGIFATIIAVAMLALAALGLSIYKDSRR